MMDWFPALKKEKKCETGRTSLESKMQLFNDDELHKDLFEISPEDMVDATPVFNVIHRGYRHWLF